jgi:hypothetical protein
MFLKLLSGIMRNCLRVSDPFVPNREVAPQKAAGSFVPKYVTIYNERFNPKACLKLKAVGLCF